MRTSAASRSFVWLVGLAFAAYLLVGAATCVLLGLGWYQAAVGGAEALVHSVPAFIALATVAVGAVLGLYSLITQLLASAKLSADIRRLSFPPGQMLVAESAGARVAVIDAPQPFSFTYGVIRPRIAVSRGLLEDASENELRAVLEHERYHVRSLDPLKTLMVRTLPSVFFYLPVLKDLRARYVTARELAADRCAAETCGRRSLAGALLKVMGGPSWRDLGPAAAIGGSDLLEARVRQLETGREPRLAAPDTRDAALSGLAAAFVTLAVVLAHAPFHESGSSGFSAAGIEGGAHFLATVACSTPWAIAAVLLYRWLSWRAQSAGDADRR